MGEQEQTGAGGVEPPMPHEGAPAADPPAPTPEPTARERREYVVLAFEPMKPDPPVAEAEGSDLEPVFWGELGRVEAFNRAGALEEVEKRWPVAVEGDDVRLHLIPERFWQEVVPEEQPPPPPRRKWKGV